MPGQLAILIPGTGTTRSRADLVKAGAEACDCALRLVRENSARASQSGRSGPSLATGLGHLALYAPAHRLVVARACTIPVADGRTRPPRNPNSAGWRRRARGKSRPRPHAGDPDPCAAPPAAAVPADARPSSNTALPRCIAARRLRVSQKIGLTISRCIRPGGRRNFTASPLLTDKQEIS